METYLPKTISFVCAKRSGGKTRPGFPGKVSPCGEFLFVRTKRNQKCAGGQARMTFSPKGRGFGQSACTPEPPILRGRRIGSASASFRRWGKPTHCTPCFRCRSPGSCGNIPGPRDAPAADRPSQPGALPWAAESGASVGISGSGKRRFVCPDLMRRQ